MTPRLPSSTPVLAAALAAIAVVGCGDDPPRRDCLARIWIPAAEHGTTVVGSWNGWAAPGVVPEPYDGAWQVARIDLPPGEHGYLLDRAGQRDLDAQNPLTTYAAEKEVSLLLVDDCSGPTVVLDRAEATAEGELSVAGTFYASPAGDGLAPDSLSAVLRDGRALEITAVDAETGRFEARTTGLGRGRHTVTLSAADENGTASAPGRAAAWIQPRHQRWQDGVLYQIMIDRFRGDGGQPLPAPANPGARAGGTLDGVRAAIEQGTFEALGITALWLSPAYDNPTSPREGNDGRLYESYHGYWPLGSQSVDERIGGAQALEATVQAAHARGLQVLLDLVPNHLYEDNPRYLERRADDWFNEPPCVCGSTSCPWGTHLQTCWFTDYLPDLRWQHPEVMRTGAADAAFWLHQYDLDGARIDAVPMMPRATSRRIAHTVRTSTFPRQSTFLVGEVFTGPGPYGIDEMRYHLGAEGYDSLFAFPLMWALRDALGSSTGGFGTVEDILGYEQDELAGSGAVVGRMLDNHDTPRFVSVAHGDAGGDPWDAPAEQPADAEPYIRAQLAMAVLFTLPGLPVLFQGDEIGLAGAGDPDCRRVMPADGELSDHQLALRDAVARLAALRTCSPALREGDRTPAEVTDHTYAYVRAADQPYPVILAVSTEPADSVVTLPAGLVAAGQYVDWWSGDSVEIAASADTELTMAPLSARILLRSDDPCR